jgi:hypothetical protein
MGSKSEKMPNKSRRKVSGAASEQGIRNDSAFTPWCRVEHDKLESHEEADPCHFYCWDLPP